MRLLRDFGALPLHNACHYVDQPKLGLAARGSRKLHSSIVYTGRLPRGPEYAPFPHNMHDSHCGSLVLRAGANANARSKNVKVFG